MIKNINKRQKISFESNGFSNDNIDAFQIDTSNWENKRGPRPWEEDNQLYQEAVLRGKQMEEKK